MADKSVGELIAAQSVTPTDLFVLEQNGTAKKLTGQVLENWLVSFADGHGGIHSIEKLSTSGLADTYRITMADTTTFDFVVTNGRSITDISKTSTSGLVDTYTISYNNGTTSEFTVTNGAKGDKGDNSYIWIKYASQEPTESSHSMGDLPDDWIGIYSGNASTAPTDWKQYKWFKHKGEHGDTGDPATLVSTEIVYQSSDSGIIIPSGTWLTFVPSVPQGKYLWTRTTQHYNSGDPVVAYSVSRFGIDGTGSVSSVADVSPDSNGNVHLTPDDIGASPLKKYGKLVAFGDSICDGTSNANYRSFVDVLNESGAFESVVKAGMNSATIGPYNVGTVANGYDLCSQIETYRTDVANADIIICEYGANDVGAVQAGNVQMGTASDTSAETTVCGYMQKAIDRIRELNPDVTIHWVYCLPRNHDDIRLYFDANYAYTAMLFTATALIKAEQNCCFVIHTPFAVAGLVASDGMHPNAEGHNLIANEVLHGLYQSADLICREIVVTLSGDIVTMTNLSMDIEFSQAYQLAKAGVNLKIQGSADGTTVVGSCSMYNEYFVMFNIIATDTAGQPILSTAWLAYDGTINGAQYPMTGQAVSQYVKDYLYKAGTERIGLTYSTNASNSGSTIDIVGTSSDLSRQVITKDSYNITANTKNLVVDIYSIDANSNTAVVLGISTSGSNIKYFDQLTKRGSSYSAGTFKLDVSDITGQYYVMIAAYGTGTCKITNWYFEETE